MLNSVCEFSSAALNFHILRMMEIMKSFLFAKLTAPMVVIRYSKEECIHLIALNKV